MQEPMSPQPRRSTLGMHLLRRSKSGELAKGQRKASKDQSVRRDSISKSPPKLPDLVQQIPNLERLSSAFGRDAHNDTASIMSGGTAAYSPRPSMDPARYASVSAPPVPPVSAAWDPYARAESMAHRGRFSYASSSMSTVNSPRRVRRRKDPTPFNILVVGTRNSGKTSFLEFLKTALALPPKKRSRKTMHEDEEPVHKAVRRGNFVPHYLETELDGESVGLTIWDSEGFEKNVVDLQLRELASFVESKFEDTLAEEMKVVRSPGFQDTHIHAVFLVLDPSRLDRNLAAARSMASAHYRDPDDVVAFLPHGHAPQGLTGAGALDDDLDLQVVRTLQGKTTVIPVISKADTITTKHMAVLKRSVWDSLKRANLDPLEALGMDEDDDSAIDTSRIDEVDEDAIDSRSVSSIPEEDVFSVPAVEERTRKPALVTTATTTATTTTSPTSPTSKRLSGSSIRRHKVQEELKVVDEVPFLPLSIISPDLYEPSVVGRKFPWGFADPYDEKHCDFVRLREAVFHEWRPELREASREQWYEGWRTSRLKGREGRR